MRNYPGNLTRTIAAIFLILFLQFTPDAQTLDHSVRRISPRPTSRDISGITKLEDGRIVASMKPTGLIYSSDDGVSWREDLTLKTSTTPANIVSLSDGNFAGTTISGEYFFTNDGGNSFTVRSLLSGSTPDFTFSKIGFANDNVSIAVYYAPTAKYLLKSFDGWQTQSNIAAPPEYLGGDFYIFSDSSIIMSAGNCIYRSIDLGDSWAPVHFSKQGNFLDARDGGVVFFSSSDSVFISTDRGMTWQYRSRSPVNLKSSQAIRLPNGDVYATNLRFDTLYKATDDITNWTMVKNLGTYLKGSPGGYLTISDTLAFLVGDFGYIYRYSGTDLTRIMVSEAYLPSSTAAFSDTLHGITSRGNHTTDGGISWTDGFTWPPIGAPDYGSYVALSSIGLGVVGFNTITMFPPNPSYVDYTFIKVTTDFGSSWATAQETYNYITYDVTSMGDSLIIYSLVQTAMGWSYSIGIISKFVSGYANRKVTAPGKVVDLAAINSRKMILAATSDSLVVSYDTARTWRLLLRAGNPIYEVTANEAGTILVRTSGPLFTSTNFGTTWVPVYTSAGQGSYALSPNGLLAFSNSNAVKYQHRNWNSWKTIDYDFVENIRNLQFVNESILMVQTARGAYYRVDISDTVTTDIENETPLNTIASFSLSQNFPNPFNPETVIRYALPEAGFTKGVVYDILGREVATLLNAEMPAGEHQLKFDAAGLPSGVYIFRLEAGGYSSTIKMIATK